MKKLAVLGVVAGLSLSANAAITHYYDGATGDITADQVGSANGSLYGYSTNSTSSLLGDGTDGGLSGGTPVQGMALGNIAGSGAFTYSVWYQAAGNAYGTHLVSFNDGSSSSMLELVTVDGGAPYPSHAYGQTAASGFVDLWGNGYDNGAGGSWSDDGALHNITMTYDGTTMTMYQDNQLAGSAVMNIDLSVMNAYVGGGSPWGAGDRAFNGEITAFGIYDEAINASGVAALYNAGNTAGVDAVAAIPEPATIGLVGIFGAGVLFVRRRMMI